MKQLLPLQRLLITVLLLTLGTLSWPYDFEVGGIYYNFISDGEGGYDYEKGVYVDGSRYNIASLVIPSIVRDPQSGKKYKVTGVGFGAFRDCESLRSITILNGVTTIAYQTFLGCSGLTSITIGSGVTSIDGEVFSGCTALSHLISYASTPPDCGSLNDINKQKCKVSVPSGCKRYYQKAYEWKDFLFIYDDANLPIHNS